MPNYSNDRPIVLEADLEPGETKEQAWTRMNQDMIAWHKAEYPHLYQEENKEPWVSSPTISKPQTIEFRRVESIPIISKDVEKLEIEIDNAKTLEELEAVINRYITFPGKLLPQINAKRKQLKALDI